MNNTVTFFLIDDDADDRELFELALEETEAGTSYECASNGPAGIQLILSGKVQPDYIFLDLNMPQMSGRECLAELKRNPATAHIPVIIFSTSSDPSDVTETRAMGAAGFITKPSKTSELTRLLEQFIQTSIKVNNH